MILLDTHALVWLDEGNPRLGMKALRRIDLALKKSCLCVSTISFWEVAMLEKKRRIEMNIPIHIWRNNLLKNGLQEIQLSGDIAIQSAQLTDFHGDPADRIITATALAKNATLCTADQKISDWKNTLKLLSAVE